jgi:hypothetical protein
VDLELAHLLLEGERALLAAHLHRRREAALDPRDPRGMRGRAGGRGGSSGRGRGRGDWRGRGDRRGRERGALRAARGRERDDHQQVGSHRATIPEARRPVAA